jgi:hypothetical protein
MTRDVHPVRRAKMGILLSEDKPILDVKLRRDSVNHHHDTFHAHADYGYRLRHPTTNLVTCDYVATAGRNGYVWDDTQGSIITPDVNFWDLLLFAIEGEALDQNKSTAGSSAHSNVSIFHIYGCSWVVSQAGPVGIYVTFTV